MLQQTTVTAVVPRYRRFLDRWPTIEALAGAPLDDVLHEWQGLGYYARARNLHRCAQVVVHEWRGKFPATEHALLTLPGIGAYTAAAVAAFAFNRRAVPLDANVERVVARLMALEEPLATSRPAMTAFASTLIPSRRAGDAAQALMELGATVCAIRRPQCLICPLADLCRARARKMTDRIPAKAPRAVTPLRHAAVYWLEQGDGRVLLRRRPEDGLFGGMMGLPMTAWAESPWPESAVRRSAPWKATWKAVPGTVTWGVTHFRIALTVYRARLGKEPPDLVGVWADPGDFGGYALPTMMKKAVRHALTAKAS